MSVAFAAPRQRGKGEITPAAIQKMLDDNNHLIQCIMDSQNKGKTSECSHWRLPIHCLLYMLCPDRWVV
ncbi:SS18 isoform 18 [Pan troglodytes]|uniref:SS18 subunit of BAF chromatin remodeling complex n=9 Tax=Hominoidea TaxID=314295 RepID=J3QQM2_HUMAN|nr:SS18 subunit of BAF chromatin remodeling complex [Homo sapiens]KAI4045841.1 SS18 subunit of BAF chromatin remodeling complex [Homo sapiens]PNI61533.1 SS18 isoform 18 [Pan troglodytes]PNJ80999.1 SS18 isoform 11 [Pongo abelii]